jgi:membrane-bound lytic murein transglycosylase MltF
LVPVGRDQLIPALLEGRGDIAAANLTITPNRLEQVDFTDPTYRNVSEIAVTGPGAEPICTVEDLSGREVYIRKSSSYHESLDKLNTELTQAGKAPVKVRLAPEELEKEAAKRGLDPNKWFNHVEVVAAEKVGRETVQYVSNVYKYYLTYRLVVERHEEREKRKEAVKKEADK